MNVHIRASGLLIRRPGTSVYLFIRENNKFGDTGGKMEGRDVNSLACALRETSEECPELSMALRPGMTWTQYLLPAAKYVLYVTELEFVEPATMFWCDIGPSGPGELAFHPRLKEFINGTCLIIGEFAVQDHYPLTHPDEVTFKDSYEQNRCEVVHVDRLTGAGVPAGGVGSGAIATKVYLPRGLIEFRGEDASGSTETAYLYDFPQGSDTWHAARQGAIGSTLIYALMGAGRLDALASMQYAPRVNVSRAMARGLVGEANVRQFLSNYLGVQYEEVGIAIHKEYPWMRASPDGIYTLPNGEIGILEIKIISSTVRQEALKNALVETLNGGCIESIPEEHYQQVTYIAGVLGAKEVTYATLLWPEDGRQPKIMIWRFEPDETTFEFVHIPVAEEAFEESK
jgi:hypothetical protein